MPGITIWSVSNASSAQKRTRYRSFGQTDLSRPFHAAHFDAHTHTREHTQMRYLGGINLGFVVLASLRFLPLITSSFTAQAQSKRIAPSPWSAHSEASTARALDILALSALGAANASQAALNFFWAKQSGRWIVGHGWDRITVLGELSAYLPPASRATPS